MLAHLIKNNEEEGKVMQGIKFQAVSMQLLHPHVQCKAEAQLQVTCPIHQQQASLSEPLLLFA
jgi:hypothetical protein